MMGLPTEVSNKKQRGFNLTELAVSLAVTGVLVFLLPTLVAPVKKLFTAGQVIKVQDVGDLVHGFVLAHNRLPCPDTTSDGLEDCAAGNDNGLLPWKTMRLDAPVRNAAALDFRYGVYRKANVTPKDDSDLTVLQNRYEPYLPPTVKSAVTHTRPTAPDIYNLLSMTMPALPTTPVVLTSPNANALSGLSNGLDFCHALRNAAQAPDVTLVHAGAQAVAFVLVDPGAADLDQDGNVFDGTNHPPFGKAFAAPDVAQSNSYDDTVYAVGFSELAGALECPAVMANVNAAARAAWAAYDEYRAAVVYAYVRDFMFIVRQTNVQINEFHNIFSIISLAITAGQLATDAALAVGSYSGLGAAAVIGILLGTFNTVYSAIQISEFQADKAKAEKQMEAAWVQVTNAATSEEAARVFADAQLTLAKTSDNKGWFQ